MRLYGPAILSEQKADKEVLISRVANLYADIQPIPWCVGVVEIMQQEGGLTGFYLATYDSCRMRYEIPVEIFNHQMKDIELDNMADLAGFMGEYGMIFDSWPGAINEMAEYNKFVNIGKWGKPSIDDIDSMLVRIAHYLGVGVSASEGREKTRRLWAEELERMRSLLLYDQLDSFVPKFFLTSYDEVVENLKLTSDFVSLAIAAAQSNKESEVAKLAGINRWGFFDEILYLDERLNGLLHVYSPKIGFQYIVDGVAGEPTYYCDLLDIHEPDGASSASLMNAVALQIRDFNLSLSDARQCAECGQVFVSKQSSRKSNRGHMDSKFCCDRCKNRQTQRKHRESAGYKKANARKASKTETGS